MPINASATARRVAVDIPQRGENAPRGSRREQVLPRREARHGNDRLTFATRSANAAFCRKRTRTAPGCPAQLRRCECREGVQCSAWPSAVVCSYSGVQRMVISFRRRTRSSGCFHPLQQHTVPESPVTRLPRYSRRRHPSARTAASSRRFFRLDAAAGKRSGKTKKRKRYARAGSAESFLSCPREPRASRAAAGAKRWRQMSRLHRAALRCVLRLSSEPPV